MATIFYYLFMVIEVRDCQWCYWRWRNYKRSRTGRRKQSCWR